jgi:hypothetical protein
VPTSASGEPHVRRAAPPPPGPATLSLVTAVPFALDERTREVKERKIRCEVERYGGGDISKWLEVEGQGAQGKVI